MDLRNLDQILARLKKAVMEEAKRNPEFEAALLGALTGLNPSPKTKTVSDKSASPVEKPRRKSRRSPALFDPVQSIKNGEAFLREQLSGLNLEQLRDMIAEYGMDAGRRVIRWTKSERVVNYIVEISILRVTKGRTFLDT